MSVLNVSKINLYFCNLNSNFFVFKKEVKVDTIANDSDRSFEVYREALEEMESGDYFIASKKFATENILPKVEFAAAPINVSYAYI